MPEKTSSFNISLRSIALISGTGLLLMAILAPISYMNIFPGLIIANDAQATVQNIQAEQGLFRIGIFLFVIVAILDVLVAWGLYEILKPVNRSISLLAAWFRITYAAVLVVALNHLFDIINLLNSVSSLEVLNSNQVLLAYNSFLSEWNLGLILFSIHLLILGSLMLKAHYVPKILSILVIIAGFGYLFDGVGKILFANYTFEMAMFTFLGEVVLIFWLIWKGIKSFKDLNIQVD